MMILLNYLSHNIEIMTKTILVLAIVSALIVGSISTASIAYAESNVSPIRQMVTLLEKILTAIEEDKADDSDSSCPAENVQHWTTLQIEPVIGTTFQHPEFASFDRGGIKLLNVQIDPNKANQIEPLIVDKLNELGYTKSGAKITLGDIDTSRNIVIGSFSICSKP